MNSVRLYFTRLSAAEDLVSIDDELIERWISELAVDKQAAIRRLVNMSDRMASLVASRLLKKCAFDEKVSDFQLCDIHYPEAGKPCWQSRNGKWLDFNISHSDNLVLVAVSRTVKVGVDAEIIRELKNLNFKMVMTPEELSHIKARPEQFFELWSKKEAIVKAANTTGIARMRDVILQDNGAMLDDKSWYIKTLHNQMKLENEFSVHLATSAPVEDVIIKHLTVAELIEM